MEIFFPLREDEAGFQEREGRPFPERWLGVQLLVDPESLLQGYITSPAIKAVCLRKPGLDG